MLRVVVVPNNRSSVDAARDFPRKEHSQLAVGADVEKRHIGISPIAAIEGTPDDANGDFRHSGLLWRLHPAMTSVAAVSGDAPTCMKPLFVANSAGSAGPN